MSSRVLVCIEDTGVAHVITARLMRDGVDGVVVDRPEKLADEARRGAGAVLLQNRYGSGEVGSSLLRQVRVARGDIAPAVVLVVGELAPPDRHVLEKQWKVGAFLPVSASPLAIADELAKAAGVIPVSRSSGDDDIVLHDDEARNEFDISIESSAGETLASALSGAFDDDDDDEQAAVTIQLSSAELDRLKHLPGSEPTKPVPVVGSKVPVSALSQLPLPGGDDDFALEARLPPPTIPPIRRTPLGTPAASPSSTAATASATSQTASLSGAPPAQAAGQAGPAAAAAPAVTTATPGATLSSAAAQAAAQASAQASSPPVRAGNAGFAGSATLHAQAMDDGKTRESRAAHAGGPRKIENDDGKNVASSAAPEGATEGDVMQIQELQRTQAQLQKALLAERKAREAAQKRVEDLEARLSRMGETPVSATQGVPADGVFEDLRYPALLARCRAEAFTGSIGMQSGGATRTVFLKDGLPVAFSSSEPGQRIGKLLVAQGRITDEQYMKAATRMVERSIKLTDALVELGLIDAESLAVEQRNTTRDQIIQGFELVQGRFTTSSGATPDANTATFDFGPGEIYVQGYRRYAPVNEMLASFETLRDKYLTANARLASYRPKLGLSGDDERFLRLLGEALTVEEAGERAGVGIESVARLLAALHALDLVEEWSPGVEQFRSRMRAERQRHAEELARVMQEARAREDRMLDTFQTFQKALADGGSLDAPTTNNGTRRVDERSAGASSDRPPRRPADRSSGRPEQSADLPSDGTSDASADRPAPPTERASEKPPERPHEKKPSSSWDARETANIGQTRAETRPDVGRSERAGARAFTTPLSSSSSSLPAAGSLSQASSSSSAGAPSPGTAAASSTPSASPSSSSAASPSSASSSSAASPSSSSAPSSSAPSSSAPSSSAPSSSAPSSAVASPAAAAAATPASSTLGTATPVETPPSPADRKYQEGIEQASQSRLDEAELTLREAVRLDATRPEFLTALARVLLSNPRYERAGTLPVVRSLLDRAVQIAPDNEEAAELHKGIVAEMGA